MPRIDPQATLDTIRELASEILKDDDATDEAMELAECIEDLDKHITRGGALPEDWDNDGN